MNNPPSHGPFSSPGMRGHSAAIEAMTLAARHQLGDKHAVTVEAAKGIDWDDLAKRGSMVTRGCELEGLVRETEVSRERLLELAEGVDKAPIVVEVQVGKRLEDLE